MTMRKNVYVKQFGIPVSEEMYSELVDLCNEHELSISEWVRGAIEMRLSQEQKKQGNQTIEK